MAMRQLRLLIGPALAGFVIGGVESGVDLACATGDAVWKDLESLLRYERGGPRSSSSVRGSSSPAQYFSSAVRKT